MASVIVTTVDDMSELTPNSLPTDQAMMVLQLLRTSGKIKDEDIRVLKEARLVAEEFDIA